MSEIPADHLDLLERPIVGHLGTVRPDGAVQVNPMWFLFDGRRLRFTHNTRRAKYRNLQLDPAMTISINDPEQPYRYIELRGHLEEAIPDPTGAFYQELARRYGNEKPEPPADAADRVILVMAVDRVGGTQ